ncbi:hypothetical protein VN24_24310 [Paenibacillus beijingensis]|uniref:GH18 domain-containing protein n=1 Tax=Paenibacillus beijingensis TaxID=1126833 RepID=A0A0D5NP93_9BACL|nr:hypothetical protein VN24_24310 [Paenibacillus beijingensis]
MLWNESTAYDLAAIGKAADRIIIGSTYVFWAETAEMVKARISIAKKYDLAGIAAWRLGYESPDLWTVILRSK